MTVSDGPDGAASGSATPSWRTFVAVSIDLVAVLVLTATTVVVATVPGVDVPGVRAVLGTLFVLFVPGYAAVSALFPERRSDAITEATSILSSGSIGGVERVMLSLGMSLGIVPLLALLVNLSPIRLELGVVLTALGGFTVVASVVAVRRRLSITVARRFRVPFGRWLRSARTAFSRSPVEALPVAIIVVSILIAGTGVAQTVMTPQNGETYTEFYLLSGEQDGVGQAANYTTDLVSGEEHSVVVGIGNHEGTSVDYAIVVRLQRMQVEDNVSTPIDSEELARFETTVADDQTEERRVPFTPTTTGQQLRLQLLLYPAEIPPDPNTDSAYREIHLWVSVS